MRARARRGAVFLVVALALAACGGDDGGAGDGGGEVTTRAELAEVLQDRADLPAEQADCVAGQVFDRLSEDEIATLRRHEDGDDLPAELERKLRTALTPCASVG